MFFIFKLTLRDNGNLMTTKFIKYCPVCGTTRIDTTSFGSDGHAQCKICKTRFTVDAVPMKNTPKDIDSDLSGKKNTHKEKSQKS